MMYLIMLTGSFQSAPFGSRNVLWAHYADVSARASIHGCEFGRLGAQERRARLPRLTPLPVSIVWAPDRSGR
jgi:hypothetical protein